MFKRVDRNGLKVTGWGLFSLPGERRRLEKAARRADELLATYETAVKTRGEVDFTVFKSEDGAVFYLEAHDLTDGEGGASYLLDRDEARRLGELLLRAAR